MGTMTNGFTRLTEQFLVHIGVERGLATATVTAYESDARPNTLIGSKPAASTNRTP